MIRMERGKRRRGRRVTRLKRRNLTTACWTGGPNILPPLKL